MRLPEDTHRHVIVGATGSGKTQFAQHELSYRNHHVMPWVIYNFKYDESIDGIPGARELDLGELPQSPGIYIAHPDPDEDEKALEAHMKAIWKQGDTGVYVDEGYMVGQQNPGYRKLLTQGRSRRIPMIILTQRPAWMDRFTFSESEFIQMFRLQDREDVRKHMGRYIPRHPRNAPPNGVDLETRLPDYHSWYYDVGHDTIHRLKPVPDIRTIHNTFAARMRQRHTA
jgi:hypothetical protein